MTRRLITALAMGMAVGVACISCDRSTGLVEAPPRGGAAEPVTTEEPTGAGDGRPAGASSDAATKAASQDGGALP